MHLRALGLRLAVLTVPMASAVAIAWRASSGPLHTPIRINSPLNLESAFAVAVTFLAIFGVRVERSTPEPNERSLSYPATLYFAALSCIAVLAYWKILSSGFLSDDFKILKLAEFLQVSSLIHAGGDGFYRPVGYVSLWLNGMWASFDPTLWHGSILAIHFLNSALLFALCRRMQYSQRTALFAAALFMVHGTRPEVAVWIAGRFDLLAALFVLAGLILFDLSLDASRPRAPFYLVLSLLCMALGILSKEPVYAFPVVLVLYAIGKGESIRRLWKYRWFLFGGWGGYKQIVSGQIESLSIQPLPLAKALFWRMWAVLYFPINWSRNPGLVLGSAALLYGFCLLRLAAGRSTRSGVVFGLGTTLALALPAAQVLLIGQDLQKSRLLYLPSIGFCVFLASLVSRFGVWEGRVVGAGVILFNLLALNHNLVLWNHAAVRAKAACEATVRCARNREGAVALGLPDSLWGVYFFRNGFEECVEIESHGRPVRVEMRTSDDGFDASKHAVLKWNPRTEELACIR
jgi:hypothetical protein